MQPPEKMTPNHRHVGTHTHTHVCMCDELQLRTEQLQHYLGTNERVYALNYTHT